MCKITIIPRVEKDGTPILFLPDDEADPGRIGYYAHIGQHGEACLDWYYNDTDPDRTNICADLISEYDSIGEKCELVIRKRRPSWRHRKREK